MDRIRELRIYRHEEALKILNDLVIDIKKQILGLSHKSITIERVDEDMRKIREDLERCWDPAEVKYGWARKGDPVEEARLRRAEIDSRTIKPE
jgi:hypothetical protein